MRIEIIRYAPRFKRKFKRIGPELRSQVDQAIRSFQLNPFDPRLKTHRLEGKLKGCYSFSVNYYIRIIFVFENSVSAIFMDLGSHSVYK